MFVRFWGTRGSIAKPGSRTLRYGGNTSCVEVRSHSGQLIVIDCGTGAHELGQALLRDGARRRSRGAMLITHTHWDHIQGIPFFAPFFVAGESWDLYGPRGIHQPLKETLSGQMEYEYFPITLESMGASINYRELVEGTFEIGDIRVTTRYLNHPALTLGYRLEADGVAVVYACDHENVCRNAIPTARDLADTERAHVAFLEGADLVIHDAQFVAEEYAAKAGWGHSTAEYALAVCRAAGARHLVLTHHDPDRDDESIDRLVRRLEATPSPDGTAMRISAAAEGQRIDVAAERMSAPGPGRGSLDATAPLPSSLVAHSVMLLPMGEAPAAVIRAAAEQERLTVVEAADPGDVADEVTAGSRSIVIAGTPAVGGSGSGDLVRRMARQGLPVVFVSEKRFAPQENGPSGEAAPADVLIWPFSRQFAQAKLRSWVLRETCRWVPAPLPQDEASRLARLHALEVLDTPAEERMDLITEIASKAFDVPMALISLVDENRQWFKSRIGIEAEETSREVSFCAHTILGRDALVITDALEDDRFADNPQVTGAPHIRFYAGCPLRTKDGSALGSLCLVDTRPRSLDDAQIRLLEDLASLVVSNIER